MTALLGVQEKVSGIGMAYLSTSEHVVLSLGRTALSQRSVHRRVC